MKTAQSQSDRLTKPFEERSCTQGLKGRWATNLRIPTMGMEFDTAPVTPARPLSRAFPSLTTLNASAKSPLVPHAIHPTVHANRTFDGDAVHGELLTFAKRDVAELEFSL